MMVAIQQAGKDWLLETRCPKCHELFTSRFIGTADTELMATGEFTRLRKHHEACFREEHRCQTTTKKTKTS